MPVVKEGGCWSEVLRFIAGNNPENISGLKRSSRTWNRVRK